MLIRDESTTTRHFRNVVHFHGLVCLWSGRYVYERRFMNLYGSNSLFHFRIKLPCFKSTAHCALPLRCTFFNAVRPRKLGVICEHNYQVHDQRRKGCTLKGTCTTSDSSAFSMQWSWMTNEALTNIEDVELVITTHAPDGRIQPVSRTRVSMVQYT